MSHALPSAELRNHYPEASFLAEESEASIFITVDGKGDSVLLAFDLDDEPEEKLDLMLLPNRALFQ
ncbi:MAG: hypothetical protein WCS90_02480 [Bacilli bacterium]